MNKKDYLYKIEKELNKYELDNYYDLLYQARDVINQIDEDNIVEILGTPENYVQELFEMNEMNPEEVKVKKINSIAKIGIFTSLLFIVVGTLVTGYGSNSWISDIFAHISMIVLFFITLGTFVNLLKKQSSVYTMTLVIVLFIAATLFLYIGYLNLATFIIGLLILVFGIVNLFENIIARLTSKRVIKKDKSFYSNSYSDNETLKVKMSFGAKNINVSDKTYKLQVESKFGETTINAAQLTHDLDIYIKGKFGQINIELPKDASVVDNCSVSFGDTSQGVRNGNGPVITINGKFSFGSIKY